LSRNRCRLYCCRCCRSFSSGSGSSSGSDLHSGSLCWTKKIAEEDPGHSLAMSGAVFLQRSLDVRFSREEIVVSFLQVLEADGISIDARQRRHRHNAESVVEIVCGWFQPDVHRHNWLFVQNSSPSAAGCNISSSLDTKRFSDYCGSGRDD